MSILVDTVRHRCISNHLLAQQRTANVQLMPLLILASPALLIWVDIPVIIIIAEDAFTAAQLINWRYIVIHHGWPASQGSRLVTPQLAAAMQTPPEQRQSIHIPLAFSPVLSTRRNPSPAFLRLAN